MKALRSGFILVAMLCFAASPAYSQGSAFSLTSPANAATGVSTTATLSWQASSGAVSYIVHIGTSNPPSAQNDQNGITATTFTPSAGALGPLAAGYVYYWSVEAINGAGAHTLNTGGIQSFTTAPPIISNSYTISSAVGSSTIVEGQQALTQPLPVLGAVAMDSSGNLYIASPDRNKVFRMTSTGVLTSFAGAGAPGAAGDGGPATAALLNNPQSIAVDSSGNVYIADTYNYRIRKVTVSTGIITTIAGSGDYGLDGDGGLAVLAGLEYPTGIAVDAGGNIYIGDNYRIRKINPAGYISTFAGVIVSDGASFGDGGQALAAAFESVNSLATDTSGNVFVVDGNRIRKITVSTGIINTVVGSGDCCFSGDGGPATAADLDYPNAITVDGSGNILLAVGNRLRRVTASDGKINTIANLAGNYGFSGDGGPATGANFQTLSGVAVDSAGNIFMADSYNDRIRKIRISDSVIQTVAGSGPPGFLNGAASAAQLSNPSGLATDTTGNVYIADYLNNRIRKLSTSGVVTTFAGNGTTGFSGDNGPATSAELAGPTAVAVDTSGNVYIVDYLNNCVRKVSPNGTITTVAGNPGNYGSSGDGGPATAATFNTLTALAVDAAGNLYIADAGSYRVRRVATTGTISTFAGNGIQGSNGDLGPATSANLLYPSGLATDPSGNVYILESYASIRKVATNGVISKFSDTGGSGISVDGAGNLYLSYYNNVFRYAANGAFKAIGGNGYYYGVYGDGGPALAAGLNADAIAVDPQGNVFATDTSNNLIRKLTPRAPGAAAVTTAPSGFLFTGTSAKTDSIDITFDGGAAFAWTAAAAVTTPSGGSWLSVLGTGSGISDGSFLIKADPAGLAPGLYLGTITITSAQSVNGSVSIPVTLTVPPAALQSSVGSMEVYSLLGANAQSRTFNVLNTSSGSLSFNVSRSIVSPPGGNWFSVSPASGTTPGTLTVSFSTTSLTAGTYVGGITATSVAASSSIFVPIVLTVVQPGPSLSLDRNLVYFNTDPGVVPTPQVLNVRNGGGGTLPWEAAVSPNANWLHLSTPSEDDAGPLTLSVDVNSLPVGTYSATVTVTSEFVSNSPAVLPVVLRVGTTVTGPYVISTIGGANQIAQGGAATSQTMPTLPSVALDSSGNLYVAAPDRHRVFKVTSGGILTTLAGTGSAGPAGDGGPAAAAQLNGPQSVAVDSSGNVYIADSYNGRVRKVTVATGIITTIAGTGIHGFSGDNGPGTSARLSYPSHVATDGAGNVYVATNSRIRKIAAANGFITTVAGTGVNGFGGDGGQATAAKLSYISGLASDPTGSLFIADGNNRIRKVTAGSGVISTVAGDGTCCFAGDGGPATSAKLTFPQGVAIDGTGNIYISEGGRIRKVSSGGTIQTFAGDGGYDFAGDGAAAISAEFRTVAGMAINSAGDVYLADSQNHRVRKITASDGKIQTVVGTGLPFSGDNGPATSARFSFPSGVASDLSGNLYIADQYNHRIRMISTSGTITTVAGSSTQGFNGDGGPATAAQLSYPIGVAVDAAGNLYIVDNGNGRIRKVDTTGIISTVAGDGSCCGFNGDGGPAIQASLPNAAAVAVDVNSNIYIADSNRIRKVDVYGLINTVVGTGVYDSAGSAGLGTSVQVGTVQSLTIDSVGNLYFGDGYSGNVRRLSTDGIVHATSFYGSNLVRDFAEHLIYGYNCDINNAALDETFYETIVNACGNSGDNGAAGSATVKVSSLGTDAAGDIFFADSDNQVIRKLTPVPEGSALLSAYESGITVIVSQVSPTMDTLHAFLLEGIGDFSWTASASVNTPSGGHWLHVNPSGASSSGYVTYSLSIDATGLALGTYNGSVVINSPQGPDETLTIPVTLTVVANNNPVPALTSISPSTAVVGSADATITLNGTNFDSGAVARVLFNNFDYDLETIYNSATQLTAVVPAYFLASNGSLGITALNPSPGGGSSGSQVLTVAPVGNGVAPTISALSANPPGLNQSLAPLNGGPFTLTVRGQDFVSGVVVSAGTANLTTTFIDSTQLTAVVPTAALAVAGSVNVKATNPDSLTSNTLALRIVERADINASRTVNIGDALACALTVGGINKPPLPRSVGDINMDGNVTIGDCLVTALFAGRVNANLGSPVISGTSPSPVTVGNALTISGLGIYGSVSDLQILFTTSANAVTRVAPATVSTGSLTVTVPNNAVSGPIQIYRMDSATGGNEFPLLVSGSSTPLALTTVSPYFAVAGGSSITLNGMGFSSTPSSNLVLFKSATGTTGATVTTASTTSMTVTVPSDAVCGPVTVGVSGQTTDPRIVTISGTSCGVQLVDSLGKAAPGETLILEGAGFDVVTPANNVVRFPASGGGTVNATVLQAGGTQLQVRVPGNAVAGNVTVTVGSTTSSPVAYSP